jgi:hypothetical protein
MNAYDRDMGQPDAVRRVTIVAEFEYCQPLISTSEQRGNASLIGARTILFVPGPLRQAVSLA